MVLHTIGGTGTILNKLKSFLFTAINEQFAWQRKQEHSSCVNQSLSIISSRTQQWWFPQSTKGAAPSVLQFLDANLHPTVLKLLTYNNPHTMSTMLGRSYGGKRSSALWKSFVTLCDTWHGMDGQQFSCEQSLCSDFFPFITSQHYQWFLALSTQCQSREVTQTLQGHSSITSLVINQIFTIGSETFTSRKKGKSIWKKELILEACVLDSLSGRQSIIIFKQRFVWILMSICKQK